MYLRNTYVYVNLLLISWEKNPVNYASASVVRI